MSWMVFWIDPSLVASQISVSVTAMLTLIAYRFALSGNVPRPPYLTRLDYFLVGLTAAVFVTLVVMAAASYLFNQGRVDTAGRINRWGRVAFPSSVLAVIVLGWWT